MTLVLFWQYKVNALGRARTLLWAGLRWFELEPQVKSDFQRKVCNSIEQKLGKRQSLSIFFVLHNEVLN